MPISHYVPESSQGETCHKCRKEPAKHKVREVMPDIGSDWRSPFNRHELTAYLCCNCFGDLMGSLAVSSCKPGKGDVAQHSVHTDVCPECAGSGKVGSIGLPHKCPYCDGTGARGVNPLRAEGN